MYLVNVIQFLTMYLTPRSAQIRNIAIATVNGCITLVILLIAPLGLAAVIFNTLLVALASYGTATLASRIILYLQGGKTTIDIPPQTGLSRSSNDDSISNQ